MIQIVFVVDNLGIGGSELNAVRTAERLDKDRFSLSVFCLGKDGPLLQRYRAAGIPVTCAESGALVRPRALRAGLAFARDLRRQQTHVVHAHDIYSNEFAVLWTRAARQGRVIASRRWLHAPGIHRSLNGLAYRLADRVLVNSVAIAQRMTTHEGLAPARLAVIPNFVDDSAFDLMSAEQRNAWRASWGVEPDDCVLGVVARLAPVKDHASLLGAVALLAPRWPSLKVLLVGDGPERESLHALAQRLELSDRVRFTGMLPSMPSPHHLLDISVLPSIREGFPNSVVEAMAAGRPVVASNVGGVPDAIDDGETGLLTPAADPTALASQLERLLGNPSLRMQLAAAGRARAWANYRAGPVLGKLMALYEELAAR